MINSEETKMVPASYESITNYHNGLVQARFAVAALFMTATAFLVQAATNCAKNGNNPEINHKIIILGICVTIACWMLELRNESLLKNLAVRGLEIEKNYNISEKEGFFHLMSNAQPHGIRIPFLCTELGDECRLPNSCWFVRYFFSHNFVLNAIYVSFLIYWIYLFSSH